METYSTNRLTLIYVDRLIFKRYANVVNEHR